VGSSRRSRARTNLRSPLQEAGHSKEANMQIMHRRKYDSRGERRSALSSTCRIRRCSVGPSPGIPTRSSPAGCPDPSSCGKRVRAAPLRRPRWSIPLRDRGATATRPPDSRGDRRGTGPGLRSPPVTPAPGCMTKPRPCRKTLRNPRKWRHMASQPYAPWTSGTKPGQEWRHMASQPCAARTYVRPRLPSPPRDLVRFARRGAQPPACSRTGLTIVAHRV
jgi:hypothetical protein